MKNIQYQQKAVSELVEKTIGLLSLSGNRHTLIFKAPTGSGKTVMASEMLMRLNDELAERPDAPFTEVAYIWIAPNKLHEQSYFKMKNHFTETKILRPVIYDELDHSIRRIHTSRRNTVRKLGKHQQRQRRDGARDRAFCLAV